MSDPMSEQAPIDHRKFVSYIDKSREYYLAQDYGNPYRWARFSDAPFATLSAPVSQLRMGLVTTASVPGDEHPDDDLLIPAVTYAHPVEPVPEGLYTMHRSWDKEATHTDDLDSFAPIHRLQEAAAAGRIGSLSPRFYGVPTGYSQRKTKEIDAPQLLQFCREDGVEAALLVAL